MYLCCRPSVCSAGAYIVHTSYVAYTLHWLLSSTSFPIFTLPVYDCSTHILTFYFDIHLVQSAVLFVTAICDSICYSKVCCVCVCVCVCVRMCVCVCVLTHGLGSSGFQNRCTVTGFEESPVIWASEPRIFPSSTALGIPLLSLFAFFCLSITNSASCRGGVTGGPCKASLWNRQASLGAPCCSGHVCWSTALQQLHIACLASPTPSSLLVRSPQSFIRPPNCFFSRARAPGKPGRSQDFIGCLWEVPKILIWLGKPSRLTWSHTWCYQAEDDLALWLSRT